MSRYRSVALFVGLLCLGACEPAPESDDGGNLDAEARFTALEERLVRAGIPLVRRQTVRFPTGEMWVVERYEGAVIIPQVITP